MSADREAALTIVDIPEVGTFSLRMKNYGAGNLAGEVQTPQYMIAVYANPRSDR
jgi:hypothetical protein